MATTVTAVALISACIPTLNPSFFVSLKHGIGYYRYWLMTSYNFTTMLSGIAIYNSLYMATYNVILFVWVNSVLSFS